MLGTSSRPQWWIVGFVTVVAVLVWGLVLQQGLVASNLRLFGWPHMVDLKVYYRQALLTGGANGPSAAVDPRWYYPAFAAVVFAGLSRLSFVEAELLWLVLQALLAGLLALRCARALDTLPPRVRLAAGVGLVLASYPVLCCVGLGQLSLLVLWLVLAALLGARSRPSLLATAIALKLYPAFYTLVYAVRRDVRSLLRVGGWLLVLGVLLPLAVLGTETTLLLSQRAFEVVTRSIAPLNDDCDTLRALLLRWFVSRSVYSEVKQPMVVALPELLVVLLSMAATLLVVAYTLLRVRRRPGNDALGLIAVMLSLSLVLEPGWRHYFVMLPLAQAMLLNQARDRATLLACAVSFTLSSMPLVLGLLAPELGRAWLSAGALPVAALLALGGLLRVAGRPGAHCT